MYIEPRFQDCLIYIYKSSSDISKKNEITIIMNVKIRKILAQIEYSFVIVTVTNHK